MPDEPKVKPGGALDGITLVKYEPGALEKYREKIRGMAGNIYATAEREDLARFWGIVAAGSPLDKLEWLIFMGRQFAEKKESATPVKVCGFGDHNATFFAVLAYLEVFLMHQVDDHTKADFKPFFDELVKANELVAYMAKAAIEIIEEKPPDGGL